MLYRFRTTLQTTDYLLLNGIKFETDSLFCGILVHTDTGGKLRIGKKADLLSCLQLEEIQTTSTPVVDAFFLDGAAVVQMLNPGTAETFQEYAELVFIPYVKQKRGQGVRRRVLPTTMIPRV